MDSEIGTERSSGQEALSLVSTLLNDPATVARLMRVLSASGGENASSSAEKSEDAAVGSDEETVESTEKATPSAEMADTLGRLSEVISTIASPKAGGGGKHTALLLAIKPYLSQRRGELIDDIIRLSSLGDLLDGLGEGGRA